MPLYPFPISCLILNKLIGQVWAPCISGLCWRHQVLKYLYPRIDIWCIFRQLIAQIVCMCILGAKPKMLWEKTMYVHAYLKDIFLLNMKLNCKREMKIRFQLLGFPAGIRIFSFAPRYQTDLICI